MWKIISTLGAGLTAALVALLAQPVLNWRSAATAAVAFLGVVSVPAVHTAGTSPATPIDAPVWPAVDTPAPDAAPQP